MTFKVSSKTDFKQGFVDLSKFEEYVKTLNKEFTEVGYSTQQLHRQEDSDEAIDMASLAIILHEGTDDGRIPPRPFLRRTLQNLTASSKQRFLRKPFMRYLESFNDKQSSVDRMLLDLGKIVRKEVQGNFGKNNKINLRDNAKITERIKGKNDPLVDSGDLRDSMLIKTSRGGED